LDSAFEFRLSDLDIGIAFVMLPVGSIRQRNDSPQVLKVANAVSARLR
jgi:hypothetical protein